MHWIGIILLAITVEAIDHEQELLRVMGLSERPKPPRRRLKVPPELMQMYLYQSGQYRNNMSITHPGWKFKSADTVWCFFHSGKDKYGHSPRTFRLHFNIKKKLKKKEVKSAELILSDLGNGWQILVHDIISQGKKRPGNRKLHLLGKINVDQEGRVSLDVTSVVKRWLGGKNYGILVELVSGNATRIPKSVHRLLVYSGNGRDHEREQDEALYNSPALLRRQYKGLYNDPTSGRLHHKGLYNRSALIRGLHRQNRAVQTTRTTIKQGIDECKRHLMYVDFKTLGWESWIIAPEGYDAFYCGGNCPLYLSDLNYTNHAIIQNHVHRIDLGAVPKPCCIPTKLSAISMLYNDGDNVVLKTFKNMIADGCGCQ